MSAETGGSFSKRRVAGGVAALGLAAAIVHGLDTEHAPVNMEAPPVGNFSSEFPDYPHLWAHRKIAHVALLSVNIAGVTDSPDFSKSDQAHHLADTKYAFAVWHDTVATLVPEIRQFPIAEIAVPLKNHCKPKSKEEVAFPKKVIAAAMQKTQAQGYKAAAFDSTIVVANVRCGPSKHEVGGQVVDARQKDGKIIVYSPKTPKEKSRRRIDTTVTHELGHLHGLGHAQLLSDCGGTGTYAKIEDDSTPAQCEPREYGDPFSVMGRAVTYFDKDPFNGWDLAQLDRIKPQQVLFAQEPGTYEVSLQSLMSQKAGVKLLRIANGFPSLDRPEGTYQLELSGGQTFCHQNAPPSCFTDGTGVDAYPSLKLYVTNSLAELDESGFATPVELLDLRPDNKDQLDVDQEATGQVVFEDSLNKLTIKLQGMQGDSYRDAQARVQIKIGKVGINPR